MGPDDRNVHTGLRKEPDLLSPIVPVPFPVPVQVPVLVSCSVNKPQPRSLLALTEMVYEIKTAVAPVCARQVESFCLLRLHDSS